MNQERLNAYHIMWLFVMFDMPTATAPQRKRYARFRKNLKKSGFSMLQYSVYVRHCASGEAAQTYTDRVRRMLEPEGKVSILSITDKQFGNMINYWGRSTTEPLAKETAQLSIF